MIKYDKVLENKYVKIALEWFEVVLIAFCIAVVVKAFIFETDKINGVSMEPTFETGEKVFIEKLSYNVSKVRRGDVIVFNPLNSYDNYIKRVIALPGETINIKDGKVYINDEELIEDYIKGDNYLGLDPIEFPYTLSDKEYFVMGDNRMHSVDSRDKSLGVITKKNIKGRCFYVISPSESRRKVERIKYDIDD